MHALRRRGAQRPRPARSRYPEFSIDGYRATRGSRSRRPAAQNAYSSEGAGGHSVVALRANSSRPAIHVLLSLVNMTVYGMPFFLEDISGSLEGSDFVDIHGRMKLTLRCTLRDRSRAVYMIQNDQSHSRSPSAVLDFTTPGTLGSISVGHARPMPMDQYLCKVSRFGRSVSLIPLVLTVHLTVMKLETQKVYCVRWSYLHVGAQREA